MQTKIKKILFLCTGNSCRSQMAEGWVKHLLGDKVAAYSAGIETHGLNSSAVQVMAEAGVDISNHISQHIDELSYIEFDTIITVCGHAKESCPIFPARSQVIHIGFADPPKLAKEVEQSGGNDQAQLDCYRKVRDEIKNFVLTLPEILNKQGV